MAEPAHAATFPRHPKAWTLEEVLALPEDQGSRVELIDGTVVVSPSPTSKHQRLLSRMQVDWDRARYRRTVSCCPA